MTINLADFINQRVDVTLSNGFKIHKAVVQYNNKNNLFELTSFEDTYRFFNDGVYYLITTLNITHIQPTKTMKKQELQERITDLEKKLNEAKEELANLNEPPKVGAVLGDGSIVVIREDKMVIVMAPMAADVICEYDESMCNYFCTKFWSDMDVSGWFLPDEKLLYRVMVDFPKLFNETWWYWSRTDRNENQKVILRRVPDYGIGTAQAIHSSNKTMRAFKLIHY